MISVDIRSPDRAMIAPFDALAARAGANVFMHPAALCAAHESGFAKVHVLLAHEGERARGLLGVARAAADAVLSRCSRRRLMSTRSCRAR